MLVGAHLAFDADGDFWLAAFTGMRSSTLAHCSIG